MTCLHSQLPLIDAIGMSHPNLNRAARQKSPESNANFGEDEVRVCLSVIQSVSLLCLCNLVHNQTTTTTRTRVRAHTHTHTHTDRQTTDRQTHTHTHTHTSFKNSTNTKSYVTQSFVLITEVRVPYCTTHLDTEYNHFNTLTYLLTETEQASESDHLE